MALLFPPFLNMVEYKTVEELQLQPQKEEEYEDAMSSRGSVESGARGGSVHSAHSPTSDTDSIRAARRRRAIKKDVVV
jgi:hypothetical protein